MHVQTWHLTGRYFHFGDHGLGQEVTRPTWPSDSLFAALIARLAILESPQAVSRWMEPFLAGTPPFLLSSTFPYAGGVRFFPVPLAALRAGSQALPEGTRFKDLKKVAFVSQGVYHRLLQGRSLAEVKAESRALQGGKVLLLDKESAELPSDMRSEKAKIWEIEKRPRVTIGRATQSSTLYHIGAVHFAAGCGLWFGVRWLQEEGEHRARFPGLLRDLADAGLGAERSSGYGCAQIVAQDDGLELPAPEGGAWTTLSRYLPKPGETPALQAEGAAYTLERVGGWLDSPQRRGQRRKAVNMLAAGATLGPLRGQEAVYGQVVDVRPAYETDPDPVGHPVYRSGLALAVAYGGQA